MFENIKDAIRTIKKWRYGRVAHAAGCNPVDGGSIPLTASKELQNIGKQLERIADIYERETQVKRVRERR